MSTMTAVDDDDEEPALLMARGDGTPAWSSNIDKPMKPKTGPELLKWMNEQWEYECTHPRNPDRWIMSQKEYEWWVEYLRAAEEERRILVA